VTYDHFSRAPRPWEGPNPCGQPTRTGDPCQEREIHGLAACLRHVSDEDLEEAEELTGIKLCKGSKTGKCRNLALDGSDPPRCTTHGGSAPWARQAAATNAIENGMAERLAEIMRANGEKLLNPDDIGNPLDELMELAGEVKAFKEVMRGMVAELVGLGRMRYSGKAGEQIRAEMLLYERAMERFAKILIDISKLKIDERLAGIRQQTADMLERALDAALEESGIPLERKQAAREALSRHLRIVA